MIVIFSLYVGSYEWELLGFPGEVISILFASGPDPYDVIYFTVQVKAKFLLYTNPCRNIIVFLLVKLVIPDKFAHCQG